MKNTIRKTNLRARRPHLYSLALLAAVSLMLVFTNNERLWARAGGPAMTLTVTNTDDGAFETTPPGVTINQAAGQADPTASTPINFTAVFTVPVSGFTDGDVIVSIAGASAVVTEIAPNDGTTYNVSVAPDQCLPEAFVTASIPAGAATDASGNGNTASTSTDNSVTVNQTCTECTRDGAPQISCPGDISVVATSSAGAVVTYNAPSCLDCFCDFRTPTQTAGLPTGATFPIGTTVNTYRVIDGGATGTCSFSVTVRTPAICPQPQGYWKNNPGAWPLLSLSLGDEAYNQSQSLAILKTPIGTGKNADASLILADQLIAAKLNVANGSDPAPISATIAAADALLAPFSNKLPYHVKASSPVGQQMISLGTMLEQYNKGLLTGCTP